MPVWTEQQQAAIDARNPTLLISAAAGSGKTAVLVERIMHLLREGASLDRMLIVTFTRAAAAEMRQRLHKRLCQEAAVSGAWAKKLDLLPQAQISTIHGFCQTVLRSDFQAAGIDPLARICTESTGKMLYQQAMEEAMNALCEQEVPDFMQLMEGFSQQEIFDMCQRMATFLMALPHPFAWLEKKLQMIPMEMGLTEHPWYQVLLQHLPIGVQGILNDYEQLRARFSEGDAVGELLQMCENDGIQLYALTQKTEEDLLAALRGLNFMRAPTIRNLSEEEKNWKKGFLDQRNALKKKVKELAESLELNEDQTRMELCQVQHVAQGLSLMVLETYQRFQAKKRRRNLIDFTDLEQMTLAVLEQPEVCARVSSNYDHIFVDECQDVSAIQDAILQKIHDEKNALFMVGDIKQSIYRFRQAEPTLFLERMQTFSTAEDAPQRRISLQCNFRSDGEILAATNDIFSKLMQREVTELDYTPEDRLIPSPTATHQGPVELHLLDLAAKSENEELALVSALEAEADVCGRLIQELRAQNYAYRDMVILMPKARNAADRVAEVLESMGIPVYCDMKGAYFDLPEVRAMLDLLHVLDNPLQDVPLLSVLKLPGFHVSDAELADIRLTDSGKDVPFYEAFRQTMALDTPLAARCQAIWSRLNGWRFRLETTTLSAFLWELMQETGYYAAVGALSEGGTRQANLRLLCQKVTEYEQVSDGSLQGFLQTAEEFRAGGDSRSAMLLGEQEDLVRIMTIHKSKGLEFPVVFVMGMGQRIHQRSEGMLHCHGKLGVCLPYVNAQLRIRRECGLSRAFVLRKRQEEKAERARLLYVAMTRASKRLFMLGSVSELSEEAWRKPENAARIWEATTMLDWVMPILLEQGVPMERAAQAVENTLSTGLPQAASHWKIRVYGLESPQLVEKQKVIHNVIPQLKTTISGASGDKLGKRWEHMYDVRERVPLKTSVSSLVRQMREQQTAPDAPEEETVQDKRQEAAVAPLRMDELPELPRFMQEQRMTGAQRGTVIHKALSLVDLDALRSLPPTKWVSELTRQGEGWQAMQLFTPEEYVLMRFNTLAAFFRSDLGGRMLASPEVHREWSFNYRLPQEQQTLLQGVVDCAFREDDHWVLLDYKTDRVTDEAAFVEKYTPQLQLYAQALSEITACPVREAWLYALYADRACPVPLKGEK